MSHRILFQRILGSCLVVAGTELHFFLASGDASCTSSWPPRTRATPPPGLQGQELCFLCGKARAELPLQEGASCTSSWPPGTTPAPPPGLRAREQRFLCGKTPAALPPGHRERELLLLLATRDARCASSAGRRSALAGPDHGPSDRQTRCSEDISTKDQ